MNTPTIGRIVHYRLSEQDVARITINAEKHGGHQGNEVRTGDVLPALVVRVNAGNSVNLQVFLDGPDVYWATSRGLDGIDYGCWFWPPRVDMTREGR